MMERCQKKWRREAGVIDKSLVGVHEDGNKTQMFISTVTTILNCRPTLCLAMNQTTMRSPSSVQRIRKPPPLFSK